MSKDFVEIRPVILKGNDFVPVFGDDARAPSTVSNIRPGGFDLTPNRDHVEGAYANLRHHKARRSLEAAGFSFEVGATYHLSLAQAVELFAMHALVPDADGVPDYGRIDPLAVSIQQAVVAARQGGASHIEIAIS